MKISHMMSMIRFFRLINGPAYRVFGTKGWWSSFLKEFLKNDFFFILKIFKNEDLGLDIFGKAQIF